MTKQHRTILLISILASFVAFLDGSIVNVALPAIVRELHGGLTTQQWVVDAYLITLGSLMLLAGALSDIFGRTRIMIWGLVAFGITSLLCAVAPNAGLLIVSRGLQGIAGALLVPSSLALIISTFEGRAQAKAIGSWTAWTGIAFIVGPLLGGFLVDVWSWRLIFAVNVIPIAITLWLLSLVQHEDMPKGAKIDVKGALFGALALGGAVYGLIEQGHYGWKDPLIFVPLAASVILGAYFIKSERRTKRPMVPLELFIVRNFSVGNAATSVIYAALSVSGFIITVFVQQYGGYTALQAGLALMPITLGMLFLSSRFGALAGSHGPRLFMALGPILAGVGSLLMLLVDHRVAYWSQLFPGIVVFGVGLAMTVAPLTSAVLGSINKHQAGVASAINNAVARIAGLIGIAAIGIITGSTMTLTGFHKGLVVTAGLLFIGGIVSAVGIQNNRVSTEAKEVV